MKTLVKKCARCGNDHEVEFKEFQHFGIGDCNWWGMCPYINEPVIMRISEKKENDTKLEELAEQNNALNIVSQMFLDTENFPKCAAWGKLADWLIKEYPKHKINKAAKQFSANGKHYTKSNEGMIYPID